jgi:hypothetical protein
MVNVLVGTGNEPHPMRQALARHVRRTVFGLHPALAPLLPWWRDGDLAAVPP